MLFSEYYWIITKITINFKKKFNVIVFPHYVTKFCCIPKNVPLPLCWCSYKWAMPWTTWRSYSVSAEATARSSLWKEHFAWRVYRPCSGTALWKQCRTVRLNILRLSCLSFFISLYLFRRLIDHAYSPFLAVLHCGNLSADVQVFPRPEPVVIDEEVEPIPRTVSTGTQHASNLSIYNSI